MTEVSIRSSPLQKIAVLGVVLALTAQLGFPQNRAPRATVMVRVDEVVGFYRRTTLGLCEEIVNFWKGAQSFERLALAEELLDHFKSTEKCRIVNYDWKAGTDDMSCVAGRAKWAFEQIIGVELGNVTPTSSEEDLRRLHYDASRLLTAYRNGILSVAGDGETSPEKLKELKDKYGGRIKPGIHRKALDSARTMHELLVQWGPIGKKAGDLIEVVGSEPDKEKEGMSFQFSTGYGGVEYQFAVSGGKIVSVKVHGLE